MYVCECMRYFPNSNGVHTYIMFAVLHDHCSYTFRCSIHELVRKGMDVIKQ